LAREYNVMMAITMISAVMVILGNLFADILYAIVDPRVQLGKKGGN
jgi:peptide/nickel transport system permease protein